MVSKHAIHQAYSNGRSFEWHERFAARHPVPNKWQNAYTNINRLHVIPAMRAIMRMQA